MGALTFFVFLFLISYFLKLIVACSLCVIYVKEDNDSNVWAMITRLIWTPMSIVPQKAIKLNHSLTHSLARSLTHSLTQHERVITFIIR